METTTLDQAVEKVRIILKVPVDEGSAILIQDNLLSSAGRYKSDKTKTFWRPYVVAVFACANNQAFLPRQGLQATKEAKFTDNLLSFYGLLINQGVLDHEADPDSIPFQWSIDYIYSKFFAVTQGGSSKVVKDAIAPGGDVVGGKPIHRFSAMGTGDF